ncbi:MAG: ATP-binding protein [Proteobacteria bacterium]|nr:ATP-binding protein [Pseudomonadota bacterium]
MHRISKAIITNFRSCEQVEITLTGYTPLVGYNNAGKSNIIRALEWAVENKALLSNDFYDQRQPVAVECFVTGITDDVLEKLGVHRQRIEPHIVDDGIRIRTTQATPGGSAKDIKREIWMPEMDKWGNPQGIPPAIQALFPEVIRIEAMVDMNTELSSNKTSTTIGKLIKAIMDPIITEQGERIREVLAELSSLFGAEGTARAKSLTSFDTLATEALQEFFPGIRARLDLPGFFGPLNS